MSKTVAVCRAIVEAGASFRIHVAGTSMLPALWPGDAVDVGPLDADALRVGEIVVFARGRHLFVHRVVGFDAVGGRLRVITRGDTRRCDDEPLDVRELLGVVCSVHRFGVKQPLRGRSAAGHGFAWLARRSGRFRAFATRINSALRRRLPSGGSCARI